MTATEGKENLEIEGTVQQKRKCTVYTLLVYVTKNYTPLFIELRRKSTPSQNIIPDLQIYFNTNHVIQNLPKETVFPCEGKVFASGKAEELHNMHPKILSSQVPAE